MSDALDHVHELWDPNLEFPVWSNLVDRAAQDRIRLLEAVAEAAVKVFQTIPGECDESDPVGRRLVRRHGRALIALFEPLKAAGYELEP